MFDTATSIRARSADNALALAPIAEKSVDMVICSR
jgi:hypothetical protein